MLDETQKRQFYMASTAIVGVALIFGGFAFGIKIGKATTIASLLKIGALPQPQEEFHNIRGKIAFINAENKNLLLETKILTVFLNKEKNIKVKVAWTDATEVFRLENKNPEEYQREFANYQAAFPQDPTLTPPSYTKTIKLNLGALAPGQEIDVFSKDNVKNKTKIMADSISLITP